MCLVEVTETAAMHELLPESRRTGRGNVKKSKAKFVRKTAHKSPTVVAHTTFYM